RRGGARGRARGAALGRHARGEHRGAFGVPHAPALGPPGGHGARRRPHPAHRAAGVSPGPTTPTRRSASAGAPALDCPHRTAPVRTLDTRRCAMSTDEKFENAKDKVGGQAKEGLGKVTGDKQTEAEGQTQQGKADAKDKLQDARDTVKGAVDGMFGKDKKD